LPVLAPAIVVAVAVADVEADGDFHERQSDLLGISARRIEPGAVMNASARAVILVSATWTFARLDAERARAALRLRVAARRATRAVASIPPHPLA
jgi:hypothetical protein